MSRRRAAIGVPLALLLGIALFAGMDRFTDWQGDRAQEKRENRYNACYLEAQMKGLTSGTDVYDAYVDMCHSR